MFFDDYVGFSDERTPKLLKEVALRYQKIVAKCKPKAKKAIKGEQKEIENIAESYLNYQQWLTSLSPPLSVTNLKSMFCEDLKIDRNTLEAYLLLYIAKKRVVPKHDKPIKEVVIRTLKSSKKPLSIKEIAIKTGLNYNTLRRTLREMMREGKIKILGRGLYHI
jgi:DNA-binding transcriptional regulator GbsR (MarR family)